MRLGRDKGFTLIELLVVIAIIAILAAILFPIFLSAKQAAARSTCTSNMGQLGKAIMTYAADYQGRIPNWVNGKGVVQNVDNRDRIWDWVIWGYVKSKKVFTCPNNMMDPSTKRRWTVEYVRSYAMAKNVTGQIVEQAPKPSKTVLLLEKGSRPIFDYADSVAEWFDQTYGYSHDSPNNFWHGKGKNFTFADGHASFFYYPSGPFSYDYPNFTAWSTAAYPNNPGGKGYCGYADSNMAGGEPSDHKAGANMPR